MKFFIPSLLLIVLLSLSTIANAQSPLSRFLQISEYVYVTESSGAYTYIAGDFDYVSTSSNPTIASKGAKLNTNTGAVDPSFPMVNGRVFSAASDNNGGWYIAGNFSEVGGIPRNDVAHILADGSINPDWNPDVTSNSPSISGSAHALAVSDEYVYIGGGYTTLNGNTARNHIARVNRTDGTVDSAWNPNMNFFVWGITLSGADVYLGGEFTTVNGSITRNRLAKVDTVDGTVNSSWNPNVTDGRVMDIRIDGGSLYAGGWFSTVNGSVSRRGVAKFNLTDGTTDSGWNANLNDDVNGISISSSAIYVAGDFTSPKNYLAKFSKVDGTVDATWNVNVDSRVNEVAVIGSDVFAAGYFSTVNSSVSKSGLAKFNDTDGTVDSSWEANLTGRTWTFAFYGNTMYVGGDFSYVGGAKFSNLMRFNTTTGEVDETWTPNINSSVNVIQIHNASIYIGGQFTQVNSTSRKHLAKIDLTTALLDSWNPNPNQRVSDLDIDGTDLYVSGAFTTIGGGTRNRLAKFDLNTDTLDATWNPDANSQVQTLLVDGSDIYVAGFFTLMNGSTARNRLAKLNNTNGNVDGDWDPNADNGAYTLIESGGSIYVGGYFTTLNGATTRNRLAKLDKINGTVDPSWNPNMDNAVLSLLAEGNDIYAGGGFTLVNGSISLSRFAILNNTTGAVNSIWQPSFNSSIYSLKMVDDLLFIGGVFSSINSESHLGFAVFPTISTTWTGTWSNGAPNGNAIATIASDYDTYLHGSFIAHDLSVETGAILTIRGDSSINIGGGLINGGTITLQDSSSLIQTATLPINSGTGNYIVEREGDDYVGTYNYWSSPVQNTSITTIFSSTGKSFYQFNAGTQAWEGADKAITLDAGKGFIATGTSSSPTTTVRSFSDNEGFNSGNISYLVEFDGTSGVADKNWNLIGNPYPSGIDATVFLSEHNDILENAVYLWSSDGSDYTSAAADYAVMNLLGVANAGGSGILPTSATISSGQGFFVQSKGSGVVQFNNGLRTTANNTFQRKRELPSLWLKVENEDGINNEILLGFSEDAETGMDKYDARKLRGNGLLSFYSLHPTAKSDEKLIIQGLPDINQEMFVPLGLTVKQEGEFTFQIHHLQSFSSDWEIWLHDAETNTETDLRKTKYKASLNGGETNDRFLLRFYLNESSSNIENYVNLYASEKQINITFSNLEARHSEIAVYDISGRLYSTFTNQLKGQVSLTVPNSGIYIIKVSNQYGVMSKKLYVD